MKPIKINAENLEYEIELGDKYSFENAEFANFEITDITIEDKNTSTISFIYTATNKTLNILDENDHKEYSCPTDIELFAKVKFDTDNLFSTIHFNHEHNYLNIQNIEILNINVNVHTNKNKEDYNKSAMLFLKVYYEDLIELYLKINK